MSFRDDVQLDELEVSVGCARALEHSGIQSFDELVACDPSRFHPRVAAELAELLLDEYDIAWGEAGGEAESYEVPEERRVPRQSIRWGAPSTGLRRTRCSRVGGLPNVPEDKGSHEWPMSPSGRPLTFLLQLLGKSAGGDVHNLGGKKLLSLFVDLEGPSEEPGHHALWLHDDPCMATLEAPVGVEVLSARELHLEAGADDRLIAEVDDPDDDETLELFGADAEEWELARDHGFASKLGGIPVGANLHAIPRASSGQPMRLLAQLVDVDEDLLFYVFASADGQELTLRTLRG